MIDFNEIKFGEGIEEYILSGLRKDEAFSQSENYCLIFHNIINLAFIYAFSCFQTMVNFNHGTNESYEFCKENGNSNSRRVLTTMRKIYKECYLSNELMQFILMDLYFDYYAGEDDRKLVNKIPAFFNLHVEKNERIVLSDYFAWINGRMNSSRYNPFEDTGVEDAEVKLEKLLKSFPFLQLVSLKFDKESGWYYFDLSELSIHYPHIYKGNRVYTFGILEKIKTKRMFPGKYYFLTEINGDSLKYEDIPQETYCICKLSQTVGVTERTEAGEFLFVENPETKLRNPIQMDKEAFLSYINPKAALEKDLSVEKTTSVIEHIYQVNYKYVKNLGLALADAITRESYESFIDDLSQTYKRICPEAFANKNTKAKEDWDTILVMLLIELGPTVVLEKLFTVIKDIGFRICTNLISRFGPSISDKFGKELNGPHDFDSLVEEKLQERITQYGASANENIKNRLRVEIKSNIILSAVVAAMSGDSSSISEKGISRFLSIINSSKTANNYTNEEKQYVIDTTVSFLKRLNCFYRGLFAYGEKKIIEYNTGKILSNNRLAEIKKDCEQEFLGAAKEEYASIVDDNNIHSLLMRFIELSNKCYSEIEGLDSHVSNESKIIYSLLGHRFIINKDKWDFLEEKLMLAMNETRNDYWVEKATDIMKFFTTGKSNTLSASMSLFDAIYPIVGNYYKMSKNQDGYDTAIFSLEIDANQNGITDIVNNVSILSEFEYELNAQYYCLPNILRSTKDKWIDPFVIKCKIFDSIFEEE